jgi:hypothetical protein
MRTSWTCPAHGGRSSTRSSFARDNSSPGVTRRQMPSRAQPCCSRARASLRARDSPALAASLPPAARRQAPLDHGFIHHDLCLGYAAVHTRSHRRVAISPAALGPIAVKITRSIVGMFDVPVRLRTASREKEEGKRCRTVVHSANLLRIGLSADLGAYRPHSSPKNRRLTVSSAGRSGPHAKRSGTRVGSSANKGKALARKPSAAGLYLILTQVKSRHS